MNKKRLYKLFSIIASFSLLVNSFLVPVSVLAQETVGNAAQEETQTPTPEPTVEATPIPIEEPTPTPDVEITPIPTEEPVLEGATVEADIPEGNETLEPEVVEDASLLLESDIEAAEEESSAQLTPSVSTDKADYAPTETVVINGSDFPINSDLAIRVTWPDGIVRSSAGEIDATDTVLTDKVGFFIALYDLRGEGQEGEYLVEVLMGTVVLRTTTFSDSTGQVEYTTFEGEIAPQGGNNWTTGNISGYKEEDQVRFRIGWVSDDAATGQFMVDFTSKVSCRFFAYTDPTDILVDYDPTTDVIDSGSGVTVSLAALTQTSVNDARAEFNVSFDSAKTVRFNFTLQLSENAAACATCSSQHVEVGDVAGGFKSSGKKTLPIPASAVAPVTDITVVKTAPFTKSIGDSISYTLIVTNLDTTFASSVAVNDIVPEGITPISAEYDVDPNSGGGTGACGIVGQTVTCYIGGLGGNDGDTTGPEPDIAIVTINGTVNNDPQFCDTSLLNSVSVTTPTLESDYQNNSDQATTDIEACAASITVYKNVLNPDGNEVIDDNDFVLELNNSDSKTVNESTPVTYPGLLAGDTYTITEDIASDYELISITDNDNVTPGGQITLIAGNNEVYVVNKQKKATIHVYKDVVAPDGISDASDNHGFTAQLNGSNDQSFSETSPTSYSVNPSSYTVTELDDGDYEELGCYLVTGAFATDFNVGSNGTVYVTCKNKQLLAKITVVKDVVDANLDPIEDSHLFSVTLAKKKKSFGEGSSVEFSVDPDNYAATEGPESNYTFVSNDGPKEVTSNGSAIITIVNKQNPGSISGYKYNADGITGLSGWTIDLYNCDSNVFDTCVSFDTTSTAGDGSYSFSNIITGFYKVQEDLRTGWTNLTSLFHNITIDPGTESMNNNFTNFENVSVEACKVVDEDGDIGSTDDQTSKQRWTVNLLIDGQVNNTETTGADGCYKWDNLGPGHSYSVSEVVPGGWTPLGATNYDFGLASSGSLYKYTFVNFENAKIIVHKEVVSSDGTTDVSDTTEFTALLNSGSGKTIAEGTDASYSDLGPGHYVVSEDTQLPSGYELVSVTDNGNVSVLSGGIYEVTIKNRQLPGYLQGRKYEDLNRNGTHELADGEERLDGWGIRLYDSNWDLMPNGEKVTGHTVNIGQYKFDDLFPATYYICEVLEDGWIQTGPIIGEAPVDENYNPVSKGLAVVNGSNVNGEGNVCWEVDLEPGDELGWLKFGNFLPQPNLSTAKVRSESTPEEILVGDTATFEVTIENTGNVTLYTPVAIDIFDTDYVDFDNSTPISPVYYNEDMGIDTGDYDGDGDFSEHLGILVWEIPVDLAPGETYVLTLNFTATAITPDPEVLATNGAFSLACSVKSEECSEEDMIFTELNLASVDIDSIGVVIEKSNDKFGGASAGETVNYTLVVTNSGDQDVSVNIIDVLPGGFTYVGGSAKINGIAQEPSQSGGVLTWSNISISVSETVTITYQSTISGDIDQGVYTNLATCKGISRQEADVECDIADSSVPIGIDFTYSDSLRGEVLGAATELPATGNDTKILIMLLTMLVLGASLKVVGYNMAEKKEGKNV